MSNTRPTEAKTINLLFGFEVFLESKLEISDFVIWMLFKYLVSISMLRKLWLFAFDVALRELLFTRIQTLNMLEQTEEITLKM